MVGVLGLLIISGRYKIFPSTNETDCSMACIPILDISEVLKDVIKGVFRASSRIFNF